MGENMTPANLDALTLGLSEPRRAAIRGSYLADIGAARREGYVEGLSERDSIDLPLRDQAMIFAAVGISCLVLAFFLAETSVAADLIRAYLTT